MKKTPDAKEPKNAGQRGRSAVTDGRGPLGMTPLPDVAQKGRSALAMPPVPQAVTPVKIGDVHGGRDPVDMTPLPGQPEERGRGGVPMTPVPKQEPAAPAAPPAEKKT
jgi:hypothetical protein